MNNGYFVGFNRWAFDKRIKTDLGLLLIISSLCAEKGYCFASNSYLGNLFNVDESTISRKLKNLESAGYITIEYTRRGAEIISRHIRLTEMPFDELQKCQPTIDENVKDNNTSINNTSINIKENSNIINNITKRKVKFTPPTLEEVEAYIKEKDLIVDAKQFIDYFEEGNWTDSKGNKVKSWKQKLLTWNKFRTQGRRSKKTPEEFKREQEADREEFFRLLREKGIE